MGRQKYLGHIRFFRKRFCTSTSFLFSSVSSRIEFCFGGKLLKNRFTCLQRRKVKDLNEIKISDATLDRQPKIQSSSVEETIQRIMGQTNNDCRFRISILTSSPSPATFACWKIRFKTEVCTCSQFPTEAMQWIKEVEMVDSVDELR